MDIIVALEQLLRRVTSRHKKERHNSCHASLFTLSKLLWTTQVLVALALLVLLEQRAPR